MDRGKQWDILEVVTVKGYNDMAQLEQLAGKTFGSGIKMSNIGQLKSTLIKTLS